MDILNKVPPQALDLEKVVLGACMIEKGAVNIANELLKPEMFYVDKHAIVYTAILRLQAKGWPIDILNVVHELEASKEIEQAGGPYYITTLTNSVVSSAHLESHCKTVQKMYLLREIGRLAGNLYQNSYDTAQEPGELMEGAEKRLLELSQVGNTKELRAMTDVLVEVMQDIEAKRHRTEELTGVNTGYRILNTLTSGWQSTDLIILAARPACGKTAFALNLSMNAIKSGAPAGVFSLEMSAVQLVKRLLANQADMYLQTLRDARMDDGQMHHLFVNGIQPLASFNLYIDDTASLTVQQFKARARRMVMKYGVKFLVLDYLQLMKSSLGKNASREAQISEISRELKIAAKELGVPIVALSQMSRAVEQQKRSPQMSDLRESGAIEQDADIIMFLFGPSQEDIRQDASLENQIFLKIAKHRNGELETLEFDFNRPFQRFSEVNVSGEQMMITGPSYKPLTENPF